jgi:hypothetical protein
MKFLPTQKQSLILLALMVLMLATRFHQFSAFLHLHDASMAIFFVAGFYLAGTVALPILMLEAVVIDWIAISLAGVSDFCVTPAYSMLAVAYGVLWYGGALFGKKFYKPSVSAVLPGALIALAACLLSFLVSNGSFYWMGGRFPDPNFAQFVERFMQYMPSFVSVSMAYIAAFGVVHALAVSALGHKAGDASHKA